MVKRYTKLPVGAHYGLGDWLMQRFTGVVMAVYTIALFAVLMFHPPVSWVEWRALVTAPFVRLATMLFFLALLYHAWVGMRDVLMDYVKGTGLRLTLEFLVAVALVFYLVWSASILWAR